MSELPPELWHKSFTHLQDCDLVNTSLVCRMFHDFAQPLLFECVHFFHYSKSGTTRYPALSDDEHASLLDKLSFCASPRIAVGIRQCKIGDYTFPAIPVNNPKINAHLSDIFSILPKLFKVMEVRLINIQLTPFELSQLHAMPSLEALNLLNCPTASESEFPDLSLSKIFFGQNYRHVASSSISLWKHIMKPAHLRSLDIAFNRDTPFFVIPTLVLLGPWPILCKITLCFDVTLSPQFHNFLRQCPQLEELQFFISSFASHEIAEDPAFRFPPGVLPRLTIYRGPLATIPSAMARRSIRHLYITPERDAHDITDTLAGADDGWADLTELDLLVKDSSHTFLATIAARCPGLRVLHIMDSPGAPWSPTELLDFLAHAKYPPRIEAVVYWVQMAQSTETAPPPDAVLALQAVLRPYPRLHTFKALCGLYKLQL